MMNITDYHEKEQVDQVLAAAHRCSARDYLMLRTLWRTGVRVNELLTITPRDIEPKNNVINVTKAKGGKQRKVHLDAETIKMLSDYVSAQQLPDDRPVFAFKRRRVRNLIKRYGTTVGKMCTLTRFAIHLRYTVHETAGTRDSCSRC
jgi:integrase